jgi:hypothetical protein
VISHTVTITLQVPVDTTALADRYGNARPGGPAALVAQIIAGALGDDGEFQGLVQAGTVGKWTVAELGACDLSRLTGQQLRDHRDQVDRAIEVAFHRQVDALTDSPRGGV